MIANSGPDLLVSFLDSVLNAIDIENDEHNKKRWNFFLCFVKTSIYKRLVSPN